MNTQFEPGYKPIETPQIPDWAKKHFNLARVPASEHEIKFIFGILSKGRSEKEAYIEASMQLGQFACFASRAVIEKGFWESSRNQRHYSIDEMPVGTLVASHFNGVAKVFEVTGFSKPYDVSVDIGFQDEDASWDGFVKTGSATTSCRKIYFKEIAAYKPSEMKDA